MVDIPVIATIVSGDMDIAGRLGRWGRHSQRLRCIQDP